MISHFRWDLVLPDRLVVILTGVTTLLFQTHWIDDLGTDEGDVLGITVSAVGSVLLLSGLALRKRWSGRALLTLAFLSVAFVSAADLGGLNAEGAFAPDLEAHWREKPGVGHDAVGRPHVLVKPGRRSAGAHNADGRGPRQIVFGF